MDIPIISTTAGSGLPEVGQEMPVVLKGVTTWKRRVVVGWKHQNDTPGGLRTGKIWGWSSEGDKHFQVYDEDFNRSKVPGDVRFCGPANFTMVRMFHPFWAKVNGTPPLDMNWKDKEACRTKYRRLIRRWRIQNNEPVDDDRENSAQPPGVEVRVRARRPRRSRAGRPSRARQGAIRSLNLAQREGSGSGNEQEDAQMSDVSDYEGHSSQEPRADSVTSDSFRHHSQSVFVEDRHRTQTPVDHQRDNSVKLDPELLRSPGLQYNWVATPRPSVAPEGTQAAQTQHTEGGDTNGDAEIPGIIETTTAEQWDSATAATSSSGETLVAQEDTGVTSLENTETQQTQSSASGGPRSPSIDTVTRQAQLKYPPLPELHEVDIKDERNPPTYDPMEFNWDVFGKKEVIVIEDDDEEAGATEVDLREPIVIDDD